MDKSNFRSEDVIVKYIKNEKKVDLEDWRLFLTELS